MEDYHKLKKKKHGRRPKKQNKKRPKKRKWKSNQSTKINLIGCDTIVNSPSMAYYYYRNIFPGL